MNLTITKITTTELTTYGELLESFEKAIEEKEKYEVRWMFNDLTDDDREILAYYTENEELLQMLAEFTEYIDVSNLAYEQHGYSYDEFAELRNTIIENEFTAPLTLEFIAENENELNNLYSLVQNENTTDWGLIDVVRHTGVEAEGRFQEIIEHPNFNEKVLKAMLEEEDFYAGEEYLDIFGKAHADEMHMQFDFLTPEIIQKWFDEGNINDYVLMMFIAYNHNTSNDILIQLYQLYSDDGPMRGAIFWNKNLKHFKRKANKPLF